MNATFIATWNGKEVVLSPVDYELAAKVIKNGYSNCPKTIYAPSHRTTIVRVWPNGRMVVSTMRTTDML